MGIILVKRAYDTWDKTDGYRILVDRLWPRGVSKEEAKIDEWAKEITPSTQIRKEWHGGEITWDEFAKKYKQELLVNPSLPTWVEQVKEKMQEQDVTLVTAAKLLPHCHVDVLKEVLLQEKK